MRTNLKGLLLQAGDAAKAGDETYGSLHAYMLLELGDHIRGLLRGEHTNEEFAKFYCLDLADTAAWSDGETVEAE